MTLQEIKSEAKRLGLRWKDVECVYRQLRAQQSQDREFDWEVRQRVWDQYATTEDQKRWWRYGMNRRFPRAFGDGDRTLIPRFDEVADGLTYSFPQVTAEDPAEWLFDYLCREWIRVPSAEDTYREALSLITGGVASQVETAATDFCFGFNATF